MLSWGRGNRGHQGRQRPIRSTLTVLLIIPVVSLIALWAYAASTTVGGAIAKRNSNTVNKVIGAPTQALFSQLTQERALTFVWQSVHGRMPRTGLDAQRTHTDAAVAAFRTAATAASSAETPTARAAVATMLTALGQLPRIRAAVDAGSSSRWRRSSPTTTSSTRPSRSPWARWPTPTPRSRSSSRARASATRPRPWNSSAGRPP